ASTVSKPNSTGGVASPNPRWPPAEISTRNPRLDEIEPWAVVKGVESRSSIGRRATCTGGLYAGAAPTNVRRARQVIRLDDIGSQHGRQILFVGASAAIHRGEKVGLVGPNGAGKSTLFRYIVKEELPDEGTV